MAAKQKQETDTQADATPAKTNEREYDTSRVSTLPKDLQGVKITYTVPSGETFDEVVASIKERLAGENDNERAAALRDTFEKAYKLDLQKAVKEAGENQKTQEAMQEAADTFKATPNRKGGGGRVSVKQRAARAEAKAETLGNEFLETAREFLDEGEPALAARVLARCEKQGIAIPDDLREAVENA